MDVGIIFFNLPASFFGSLVHPAPVHDCCAVQKYHDLHVQENIILR